MFKLINRFWFSQVYYRNTFICYCLKYSNNYLFKSIVSCICFLLTFCSELCHTFRGLKICDSLWQGNGGQKSLKIQWHTLWVAPVPVLQCHVWWTCLLIWLTCLCQINFCCCHLCLTRNEFIQFSSILALISADKWLLVSRHEMTRFKQFWHPIRGVISTFSWGAKIFLNFSMPPDYWKIGKNSTLYVVIWRYS